MAHWDKSKTKSNYKREPRGTTYKMVLQGKSGEESPNKTGGWDTDDTVANPKDGKSKEADQGKGKSKLDKGRSESPKLQHYSRNSMREKDGTGVT